MPKDMLGTLSLSDVQGPMNELQSRLAGNEGQSWLNAFKRFLRKEDPWVGFSGPRIPVQFYISTSEGKQFERDEDLSIAPAVGMSVCFYNDRVNPDYDYTVKDLCVSVGGTTSGNCLVIVTLEDPSEHIDADIAHPDSGWREC